MATFAEWAKSDLLRFRTFDFQEGNFETRSIPGGHRIITRYPVNSTAAKFGMTEDDFVSEFTKIAVAKHFAVERQENVLLVSWDEDGIKEVGWQTSIAHGKQNVQDYPNIKWKDEYTQESRLVDKIVYHDGKERVLKTLERPHPVQITKDQYDAAEPKTLEMRTSIKAKDSPPA